MQRRIVLLFLLVSTILASVCSADSQTSSVVQDLLETWPETRVVTFADDQQRVVLPGDASTR
jgi:hypothetical protein